MEQINSVAAVIGFINGLKLLELKDKKPFFYFICALVLGVVFGYFKFFGISGIEEGLLVALASSGYYKLVSKLSEPKLIPPEL